MIFFAVLNWTITKVILVFVLEEFALFEKNQRQHEMLAEQAHDHTGGDRRDSGIPTARSSLNGQPTGAGTAHASSNQGTPAHGPPLTNATSSRGMNRGKSFWSLTSPSQGRNRSSTPMTGRGAPPSSTRRGGNQPPSSTPRFESGYGSSRNLSAYAPSARPQSSPRATPTASGQHSHRKLNPSPGPDGWVKSVPPPPLSRSGSVYPLGPPPQPPRPPSPPPSSVELGSLSTRTKLVVNVEREEDIDTGSVYETESPHQESQYDAKSMMGELPNLPRPNLYNHLDDNGGMYGAYPSRMRNLGMYSNGMVKPLPTSPEHHPGADGYDSGPGNAHQQATEQLLHHRHQQDQHQYQHQHHLHPGSPEATDPMQPWQHHESMYSPGDALHHHASPSHHHPPKMDHPSIAEVQIDQDSDSDSESDSGGSPRDDVLCCGCKCTPIREVATAMVLGKFFSIMVPLVTICDAAMMIYGGNSLFVPAFADLVFRDSSNQTGTFHFESSMEIAFACFFILKTLALFFHFGPADFFASSWCRFDLVVCIGTTLALFPIQHEINPYLDLFRPLRVLQLLVAHPRPAVMVSTLVQSIPVVLPLFFIIFGFAFVTAIVTIYIWAGGLWSCNDLSIATQDACVGYFFDNSTAVPGPYFNSTTNSIGMLQPRMWRSRPASFDNVYDAWVSLVRVISFDGWTSVGLAAVKMTEFGLPPYTTEEIHSDATEQAQYTLLIFYLFIANLLFMQLAIAIVYLKFQVG